jgi:ribonuclease-3
MDSKSRLQEIVQSIEGSTPHYKVISEDGPDHEKTFKIGVYIEENLRGTGEGPSKQIAQQRAAEAALAYYADKK